MNRTFITDSSKRAYAFLSLARNAGVKELQSYIQTSISKDGRFLHYRSSVELDCEKWQWDDLLKQAYDRAPVERDPSEEE